MPIAFSDIKNILIGEFFSASFPAGFDSNRIYLENEQVTNDESNINTYLRLFVRNGAGIQQSLGGVGSRKFTRVGAIQCYIYSPVGEGSKVSDIFGDVFRHVYEGKKFGFGGTTIYTHGVTYNELDVENNVYFIGELGVSFNYDEVI